MEDFTPEAFDPEERNTSAQGEDYPSPPLLHTYTTGGHDHYWESRGIQPTGEQVVRCRHCAAGMEIEPDREVVDGKITW